MRKMNTFLALSFALAFSSAAYGGWADAGQVTRIHSGHGDGGFYFSTSLTATVAGCDNTVGYYVNEKLTNANRIYSILMYAHAAGKDVAIYTTGLCAAGRPDVNAVEIKETPYY
jgi:uncharacterized membrane protein